MPERPTVSPENVSRFRDWLASRGGLLIWESVDLCNPGQSWTTPARKEDGSPMEKPTWRAGNNPRLITQESEIDVITFKELETVPVRLRMGSQGFMIKMQDSSVRNMDRKANKWRKKYPNKEIFWMPTHDLFQPSAVVLMEDEKIPLDQYPRN